MAVGTLNRCGLAPEIVADGPGSPAFDVAEVYETNFRYVWRCLRSLGVNDELVDDALQDVFVVAQRRLSEFDGRVELTTWLYAIALRIARKYRERARNEVARFGESLEEGDLPASHADLEAQLHCSERLLVARAALDRLEDDKREVFVLAQVEQRSAPEIASILGVPVNTVYSRLRIARQAFSAEVKRQKARSKRSP
jgi:RNA polymerase sigma-70 factor, ECF subfamily